MHESNRLPTKNIPAPFVPKFWTDSLAEIGGISRTGQPRLRLVWGQELQERIDGELRYRYCYGSKLEGWIVKRFTRNGKQKSITYHKGSTQPVVNANDRCVIEPDMLEVGIDRFYLEQLFEPEHLVPFWELVRERAKIDDGIEMGEAPTQGMYIDGFHMIADHSHCPCDRFGALQEDSGDMKAGERCFGAYRPPDNRDLGFIAWMFDQLKHEPAKYNWHEPVPMDVQEQAYRDYKTRNAEAAARKEQRTAEQIHDLLSPHLRRITEGTSGGLDQARYHDFGPAIAKLKETTDGSIIERP